MGKTTRGSRASSFPETYWVLDPRPRRPLPSWARLPMSLVGLLLKEDMSTRCIHSLRRQHRLQVPTLCATSALAAHPRTSMSPRQRLAPLSQVHVTRRMYLVWENQRTAVYGLRRRPRHRLRLPLCPLWPCLSRGLPTLSTPQVQWHPTSTSATSITVLHPPQRRPSLMRLPHKMWTSIATATTPRAHLLPPQTAPHRARALIHGAFRSQIVDTTHATRA